MERQGGTGDEAPLASTGQSLMDITEARRESSADNWCDELLRHQRSDDKTE